jgi:Fe2+ or Zn2+ uptake regulation protein
MKRAKDEIVAELRQRGFRITRQRLAIIGHVAGRDDHPSVREIHGALKGAAPWISLATVYNTMAMLVQIGVVGEVEFEAEDNRYDTNLAPHINLVCTRCGSIQDFDHALPVAPEEIKANLGFYATRFRMEYQGVCASCRSKAKGFAESRKVS